MSSARDMNDRLLVYEGYSPKGLRFEYKDTGLCFYCRDAKKRRRPRKPGNVHGLEELKALLWEMNKRKQ